MLLERKTRKPLPRYHQRQRQACSPIRGRSARPKWTRKQQHKGEKKKNDPITIWRAHRAEHREQERERLRERSDERAKAQAYAAYTKAGGTEEEFDYHWPQLRWRMLADKAVEGVRPVPE